MKNILMQIGKELTKHVTGIYRDKIHFDAVGWNVIKAIKRDMPAAMDILRPIIYAYYKKDVIFEELMEANKEG